MASWIREQSVLLGYKSARHILFVIPLVLSGCASDRRGNSLPGDVRADRVVVDKAQHVLTLMNGDRILKTYRVSLGRRPAGPKVQQGDHRTPEGNYVLDRRNEHSRFYRSIHISHPSPADRQRAAAAGVPPGGDVMIHGLPNGFGWLGETHRLYDWTDGCVAVTDPEMDEIWRAVPDGTPIEIRP